MSKYGCIIRVSPDFKEVLNEIKKEIRKDNVFMKKVSDYDATRWLTQKFRGKGRLIL